MLLAVDIGNTNIKFGVFDGDDIVARFSVPTASAVNEVVSSFTGPIEAAIICSVVPNATDRLIDVLRRKIGKPPFVVTNDLDFGLKINYEPISAVGTDRLVNSFAAAEQYGLPCIVCSFGSATTIDAVSGERELLGGLIAPGFGMMAGALHLGTAQLPATEIGRADSPINHTTRDSIRAGIFYSQLGLIETAVSKMKEVVGEQVKVIATGGFSSFMAERSQSIDQTDENLTLNGLRILSDRIQPA